MFYPRDRVIKTFGSKYASVFKAALLGIPLPLCSCGVVSSAISLRKQGASRGAAISFLISTPETGVDSIAVTYALLDPIMTIFRPIAAFITAVFAGILTNVIIPHENEHIKSEACRVCGSLDINSHNHTKKIKIKRAMEYAFVDLLGDISGWLIVGIVLAGIISVAIPSDFFIRYIDSEILSMFIMLFIGIPLYICATASTPVAAALILRGLSPGAALVLLLAGPATNMASILMIGKEMGKKTTGIYLASIAVTSILMGTLLNWIYGYWGINPLAAMGEATDTIPDIIKIIGSVALAILIINSQKGKIKNFSAFISRGIKNKD